MAKGKVNGAKVYHWCGHRYDIPDPHSVNTAVRLTSAKARHHNPIAKVAGLTYPNCNEVMALDDLIELTYADRRAENLIAFQKMRRRQRDAPNVARDIRTQISLAGRSARALEESGAHVSDRRWIASQTRALLEYLVEATKLTSAFLADLESYRG